MRDKVKSGKIITFYSYKGGTGRSMALANVAWILASAGHRVLAVDWDLEAPGLHRYFRPFLLDKDLTSSEGVIDMVLEYAVEAITPSEEQDEKPEDWYVPYANVLRYAISLRRDFGRGRLDLIPAGRQTHSYPARINSFDWRNFYERLGGVAFLDEVIKRMRDEYDYVLIDSRTGVSDTSGICTIHMPDILVVCFTLNNQSIDGAAAVTRSVLEQRGSREVLVYPVPMRVDIAEKKKLELRTEYAKRIFGALPAHLTDAERELYLKEVEYPYIPFYAYEEILATFGDSPGKLNTLLAATERLVGHLTEGKVRHWAAPTEVECKEVRAYYEDTALSGSVISNVLVNEGKGADSSSEARPIEEPALGTLVHAINRLWYHSSRLGKAFATLLLAALVVPLLYFLLTLLSPSPRPNLSGTVEQIVISEDQSATGPGTEVQVFIRLSIMNNGAPTTVGNYSLRITNTLSKNTDSKGLLPGDLKEISSVFPAGSESIIVRPEESMVRQTIYQVDTGKTVRGWLRFAIPVPKLDSKFLQQPGLRYVVSFADGTENIPYEVSKEMF
jgi:MinD-like ATPase involved in chromosome partitioning or flagellar assembly